VGLAFRKFFIFFGRHSEERRKITEVLIDVAGGSEEFDLLRIANIDFVLRFDVLRVDVLRVDVLRFDIMWDGVWDFELVEVVQTSFVVSFAIPKNCDTLAEIDWCKLYLKNKLVTVFYNKWIFEMVFAIVCKITVLSCSKYSIQSNLMLLKAIDFEYFVIIISIW